jgi:hypothetical protein
MLNESDYNPEGFPVNAILAGGTSERALAEVLGWYRFDLIRQDEKDYWLRPPFAASRDSEDQFEGTDTVIHEEPTDEKLVRVGSDAAGEAAVAYACGPTSIRCGPERLEEFWTWWLTEAIPKAWQMAASEVADQGELLD